LCSQLRGPLRRPRRRSLCLGARAARSSARRLRVACPGVSQRRLVRLLMHLSPIGIGPTHAPPSAVLAAGLLPAITSHPTARRRLADTVPATFIACLEH